MYDPSLSSDIDEYSEFIPTYSDEMLDQVNVKILKHGKYKDELDLAAYDENASIHQSSNVASVFIMKGIWTGSTFTVSRTVRTDSCK